MRAHATVVLSLTIATLAGCASNQQPSPWAREWAQQQIAEKQRLEAEQAKHAEEVARLKAENERIQAKAKTEEEWANIQARVAAHKPEILAELTKGFEPSKQSILDYYEPNGRAVEFIVNDFRIFRHPTTPEKPVLLTSHILIWQKPDGGGGVMHLLLGFDIATNGCNYATVNDRREFTREQFNSYTARDQALQTAATPKAQPSAWAPTQETVNSGYQAAIKIGATAAIIALGNMLSGN